jgi:hypothetical protein
MTPAIMPIIECARRHFCAISTTHQTITQRVDLDSSDEEAGIIPRPFEVVRFLTRLARQVRHLHVAVRLDIFG